MIVIEKFYILLFVIYVANAYYLSTPLSYDPDSENWNHLSFGIIISFILNVVVNILLIDSKNFMCDSYVPTCKSFLSQIGCTNHTIFGCDSDLTTYNGQCICYNPVFVDKSDRINEILIDNRMKNDMNWMLEPWETGPPYDYATSCKVFMLTFFCIVFFISLS